MLSAKKVPSVLSLRRRTAKARETPRTRGSRRPRPALLSKDAIERRKKYSYLIESGEREEARRVTMAFRSLESAMIRTLEGFNLFTINTVNFPKELFPISFFLVLVLMGGGRDGRRRRVMREQRDVTPFYLRRSRQV